MQEAIFHWYGLKEITMEEALLPVGTSYAEVYDRFRWQLTTTFNMAVDACDRNGDDPSRLAMIYEDDTGQVSTHTFAEFRARSNQLAHVLSRLGIARGDRVGIILSQRPETAVAHLAAYKLGAIALPLSTLFGPEALDYRLRDAAAQVVITDVESLDRVLGVRAALPALRHVICVDRADAEGILDYQRLLADASDAFAPVVTAADDPRSSFTRLARQARQKVPCMRTVFYSGICQRSSFIMSTSPSLTTGSGLLQTGPGLAGCTTCSFRAGTTA